MTDRLLAGRRVLVVEDEMMILSMLEDMLADLGASVSTAATVDQALHLVDAQVFDVALLDVNLNGDASYPIADLLAARGVPFVFATGYSNLGMRDEHRDRPMLKKPYRLQQLVDVFTRLLSCSSGEEGQWPVASAGTR